MLKGRMCPVLIGGGGRRGYWSLYLMPSRKGSSPGVFRLLSIAPTVCPARDVPPVTPPLYLFHVKQATGSSIPLRAFPS